MGKRHQGGGADLAPAEVVVAVLLVGVGGELVHQPCANRGDQPGDEGGEQCRDDDLVQHALPHHAVEADSGDGRTNQAAEQGVGGRGRDAEQPGEQVPHDAASQAGEHHEQEAFGVEGVVKVEKIELHNATRDRLGHGNGEEGADQVEYTGQCHSDFRAERAGGDGGGHRVCSVMETVSEVEEQGNDNDEY